MDENAGAPAPHGATDAHGTAAPHHRVEGRGGADDHGSVGGRGVASPAGITVEDVDGTTVVVLRGEIDAGQREAASSAMVAVLGCTSPLVLDTSGVTFIDSSGLAFLLQLHAVAVDAERPVVLRDPSGAVVDLLALVGLDTLFVTTEAQGV